MTKIGIISDVHANPIALKKVFAQETAINEWFFLGDAVGYGPFPIEAIVLLITHIDPDHWLIGNHDAILLNLYDDSITLPARKTIMNQLSILHNKGIGLYGWCKKFWTIDTASPRSILDKSVDYWFAHGMVDDWPNCIMRYVFPFQDDDSYNDIRHAFNNLNERRRDNHSTVLFCGHSHMPTFLFSPYRQNYYQYRPIHLDRENSLNETGLYVVNTGSVGFSRISKRDDRCPYAYYVVLDISQNTFQFKRIGYEGDRLIEESNKQNATWDRGKDGMTVRRFYEAAYMDANNKREWEKVYRETEQGWEPIIDRHNW